MSQVTDNTQSADRNDSTNSNAAAEIKSGATSDDTISRDSETTTVRAESNLEVDTETIPNQQEEKIENPFDDSVIAEKYKTPHEIAIERLGTIHEHCAKIIQMFKLLKTECFIPAGFEMNKLLDFNNITSFEDVLNSKTDKITTIDKKLACFPILVDALYVLYARIVDETAPFIMMPRNHLAIGLQFNAMGRSKYLTHEQQATLLAGFLNFLQEPTMKNLFTQHIPYIMANDFSISDVELMFKRNIVLHLKPLIALLIKIAYKKFPAKIPEEVEAIIQEAQKNEVPEVQK